VLLWQGWGWLQRGALAEAEEGLRRYRGAVQRRGGEHEAGAAYGIGFLTRVLVARGELAEARQLAELPRESTAGPTATSSRCGGRRGAAGGRAVAEALATLDAVPRRRRPVVNPVWAPWGSLAARALCGLGRTEEALARSAEEVTAARAWGSPTGLGAALRALGTTLDAAGSADAQAAFEEAVAVTEGSAARLEHARLIRSPRGAC
jgi:hypothetical protein